MVGHLLYINTVYLSGQRMIYGFDFSNLLHILPHFPICKLILSLAEKNRSAEKSFLVQFCFALNSFATIDILFTSIPYKLATRLRA